MEEENDEVEEILDNWEEAVLKNKLAELEELHAQTLASLEALRKAIGVGD